MLSPRARYFWCPSRDRLNFWLGPTRSPFYFFLFGLLMVLHTNTTGVVEPPQVIIFLCCSGLLWIRYLEHRRTLLILEDTRSLMDLWDSKERESSSTSIEVEAPSGGRASPVRPPSGGHQPARVDRCSCYSCRLLPEQERVILNDREEVMNNGNDEQQEQTGSQEDRQEGQRQAEVRDPWAPFNNEPTDPWSRFYDPSIGDRDQT